MMTPIEMMLSKSASGKRELVRQELIVAVTEQIWAAMEASGATKANLAKLLGSSKSNVTQLLCGDRNLTLSSLADIASALNLKVSVQLMNHQATTLLPHQCVAEVEKHCAMTVVKTASPSANAAREHYRPTVQLNSARAFGRAVAVSG